MVKIVRVLLTVVLTLGIVVTDITAPSALSPRRETSGHHLRDGFRNISPDYVYPLLGRALRTVRQSFEPPPGAVTRPLWWPTTASTFAPTARSRP